MQVCSPEEYDRVMARLETIPSRVKHLIVQLGSCVLCCLDRNFRLHMLRYSHRIPPLGVSGKNVGQ
jgi:hypothetical protein